jgi:hypothetical protein
LSTEQSQGPGGGQPSEEELRAAFEDQMRRITVPDVIVQTAVTLVNLGAQKLGEDGDLEQAKMAIDGARALMPLLPDEVHAPVKDALSQLQMAFVREAQGAGEPPADAPKPPQQGAPAEPEGAAEEAERAKARSKIWTPPGT